MTVFKKIALRIFIIIAFLIISNFIYSYFFFESDLQEHSEIINKIRTVESCKVIYFGESSNTTVRSDDINKKPISDLIAQHYPSLKFGLVNKGAVHAGMYKTYLQQLPQKTQVETIIITLNLRSFNAGWIYSKLETPLQKSIVLLKKYPQLYNRFKLSFKAYDNKTEEERKKQVKYKWKKDILRFPYIFPHKNVIDWDKYIFKTGILNSDGSGNQEKTKLACHYVKSYAFSIDTLTNPRIKDFDEIVEYAKKQNWNIVFNLLAENTEKASELVGEDLIYLLKRNRDVLVSRYTQMGAIVVDNLELVPDEQFIDQNWTTEHYAEKGRKIIAKNVAESLKILYSDKYVDVEYKNDTITNFLIKCEQNESWGQMQTLSTEQAFSGKTSSKTGNGDDFSVTFEWGIKNIPDTVKTIEVKCKVFQTIKENDAVLAFEVRGEEIENFRHTQKISSFIRTTDSWQEINYSYEIPSNLLLGDLIKIYIYNPTIQIVYVDDLEITFK